MMGEIRKDYIATCIVLMVVRTRTNKCRDASNIERKKNTREKIRGKRWWNQAQGEKERGRSIVITTIATTTTTAIISCLFG